MELGNVQVVPESVDVKMPFPRAMAFVPSADDATEVQY
jgi:hypothetical protein